MTEGNQKAARSMLLAAALLLLAGCGPAPAPAPQPAGTPALSAPAASPTPTEKEASDPGMRVEEKGRAAIDWSCPQEGYIMARRGEGEKRWKLRVTKDTEYIYELTGEDWAVLPLSEGDGEYTAVLFEQVEGTAYLPILTAEFHAELTDPRAPFLRPNQQVDYTAAPQTLAKAAELTADAADDTEKTKKIYEFVSSVLRYDEELAGSVQSGYIPVLDEVLEREKGICLDFAALMTAMLRSVDVPCRLVVGDAGTAYHAWTEVWDADTETWTRYDPTFAASGKDTSGVEYTPKFYY